MNVISIDPDEAARRMEVARLRQHHDDLKLAIDAMVAQRCDPLAVQRMKKRKLDLKDQVTRRASALSPDRPA